MQERMQAARAESQGEQTARSASPVRTEGADVFGAIVQAMSKEERAKLQDPKLDQRARFGLIIKAIEEKPELEKALGKQLEQRDRFSQQFTETQVRAMNNGREMSGAELFKNGFELHSHTSAVTNWDDGEEVRQVYYPEICEKVKELTGATHTFCANHLRRNSDLSGVMAKLFGVATAPIESVHNDFTSIYGDALIRSFEQEDGVTFGNVDEMKAAGVTEEVMRNSRLVMVNTWRSVSDEPLQRNPLAVCDVRTVGLDELVASRLGGNADSLEVYSSMFSPEHEWYYYPEMNKDEVLMILTYDSAMTPFVPTLHTSFSVPGMPEDAPARRSCEARGWRRRSIGMFAV